MTVCSKQRGFTLMEVLLAVVILAIIMVPIYSAYTTTFRNVNETEAAVETYQMARIALDRIVEDLESIPQPISSSQGQFSQQSDSEEDSEAQFEGVDDEMNGKSADSMSFVSNSHLRFGANDLPGEKATIQYYTQTAEDGEGLVLYRSDTMDLEEPVDDGDGGFPICNHLQSVEFGYLNNDGEDVDEWDYDIDTGLPKIVSITLEFINRLNPTVPITVSTKVAIPSASGDESEQN